MRKKNWILILLVIVSLSGRLIVSNHTAPVDCDDNTVQKQTNSKQEEEVLGTMILLPMPFSFDANTNK